MRSVPSSGALATGAGASATGAAVVRRGVRGAAVAVSLPGGAALALGCGVAGSLAGDELAESELTGTRSLKSTYVAMPPPTAIARTATIAKIRPFTTQILCECLFH
jgi:hypothetical protein